MLQLQLHLPLPVLAAIQQQYPVQAAHAHASPACAPGQAGVTLSAKWKHAHACNLCSTDPSSNTQQPRLVGPKTEQCTRQQPKLSALQSTNTYKTTRAGINLAGPSAITGQQPPATLDTGAHRDAPHALQTSASEEWHLFDLIVPDTCIALAVHPNTLVMASSKH